MKEKELYFIALVPEEPLYSTVMELKEYFKEHYQSRKALNSPPHVTLQMPFKRRPDREDRVDEMLQRVADTCEEFQLRLNGFGFFEPRVVYIDLEESKPLISLHKEVGKAVREHLKLVNDLGERPFRPHMTIAFRDLKKPLFFEAKKEFNQKSFEEQFYVKDICLLKHNGSSWDIYRRYGLIRR